MAAPQYLLYLSKGYPGSRISAAYADAIAAIHPGVIEQVNIYDIDRSRIPSYLRGSPTLLKYESPGAEGPSRYEGKYCIKMLAKLSGGKTLADLGINDVRVGGSRVTPRPGGSGTGGQPKVSEGGLRELDLEGDENEETMGGGGGGGDSKYDNLF